jgi:hypothetical protein
MAPTTDLAELRAAKRELIAATWRAESALADLAHATNRVRRLMGLEPIEPWKPWPGAVAQDAVLARVGWDACRAREEGTR